MSQLVRHYGFTGTWIRRLNFAWGSLTILKSQTREPRVKVPPGGLVLRIFTSWKNPTTSAGFEPTNLDLEVSTLPRDHRVRDGVGGSSATSICKVISIQLEYQHDPIFYFLIAFINISQCNEWTHIFRIDGRSLRLNSLLLDVFSTPRPTPNL